MLVGGVGCWGGLWALFVGFGCILVTGGIAVSLLLFVIGEWCFCGLAYDCGFYGFV